MRLPSGRSTTGTLSPTSTAMTVFEEALPFDRPDRSSLTIPADQMETILMGLMNDNPRQLQLQMDQLESFCSQVERSKALSAITIHINPSRQPRRRQRDEERSVDQAIRTCYTSLGQAMSRLPRLSKVSIIYNADSWRKQSTTRRAPNGRSRIHSTTTDVINLLSASCLLQEVRQVSDWTFRDCTPRGLERYAYDYAHQYELAAALGSHAADTNSKLDSLRVILNESAMASLFPSISSLDCLQVLELTVSSSNRNNPLSSSEASMRGAIDNTFLLPTSLRYLYLERLDLTPAILSGIGEALRHSRLTALVLFQCEIPRSAADEALSLCGDFATSKTLSSLHLEECHFPHRVYQAVFEAAQKNFDLTVSVWRVAQWSRLFHSLRNMNQAGRQYALQGDDCQQELALQVLSSTIDDLDGLYIHTRENPRLCSCLK